MTRQKRSGSATQLHSSRRSKAKSAPVAERTEGEIGLAQLTTEHAALEVTTREAALKTLQHGPEGVLGSGPIEDQAALLGESRLPAVQRQVLAAEIGQMQGNRHLQRVCAAVSGREEAVPEQSPGSGRPAGPAGGLLMERNSDDPTAAVIGREDTTKGISQASLTVQRTPDGTLTQAGQEQEAAQTLARLRAIPQQMLSHSNQTVRNTGGLLVRQGDREPRLRLNSMTLRSDSADLVRRRRQNPNETAYYFYGPIQDNRHRHSPNAAGTVDDDTILIRGVYANGTQPSDDELIGTIAHESSHILVASYGEHPRTTLWAQSFDRYKDEFRAYWIEPVGHWAAMNPDANKAHAIRDHLVGTSPTDPDAYPSLRNRYWRNARFRREVDSHLRPDGFNLSNSPHLDRFFQMLNAGRRGGPTVEELVTHIILRLSSAERTEAEASPLIQRLTDALGGEGATHVRHALSPRLNDLLQAITQADGNAIKSSYQALTPAERGDGSLMQASLLVHIDRNIHYGTQRASVYAMVVSGRIDQYDAMGAFLNACLYAQIDAAIGALREVPPAVRGSLRRLVYEARLALYRLVEDVRREYVDVLTEPVRSRILRALREGGEP